MPFTLQHNLISERLEPQTHESAQGTYFTVAAQGTFQLLYPGRWQKLVQATVRHSMRIDNPIPPTPEPPPSIDGVPTHPAHPTNPIPQPLTVECRLRRKAFRCCFVYLIQMVMSSPGTRSPWRICKSSATLRHTSKGAGPIR